MTLKFYFHLISRWIHDNGLQRVVNNTDSYKNHGILFPWCCVLSCYSWSEVPCYFFSLPHAKCHLCDESLRLNCRQVVQSACHYVQTEQSLTETWHLEWKAKRRCSEATTAVAVAVRLYTCDASLSSAKCLCFLYPTTGCLFSFPEVKASIIVVIHIPSSLSALFSFPRLAAHCRQRWVLPPASSWKPCSLTV